MLEHPVSYALRLITLAFTASKEFSPVWRRTLYLAAAAAGGVIVWYGYRVGWTLLLVGIGLELGDWLLCHLPYEPLKRHNEFTDHL